MSTITTTVTITDAGEPPITGADVVVSVVVDGVEQATAVFSDGQVVFPRARVTTTAGTVVADGQSITVGGTAVTVVAPTATAINAALAAASPGDIIEVQAGTVTGAITFPQVTMNPPVTLRAQGATSVKVSPANVSGPKLSARPVWLQDGIVYNAARGFIIEGFRISRDGSLVDTAKIIDTTGGYNDLTMDNCELFDSQPNGMQGAVVRSKFRIVDGQPPLGTEAPNEIAAYNVERRNARAFRRNPFGLGNLSENLTIQNCWFHDTNGPALWMNNFTFQGNYLEDLYTGAMAFGVVRDLDGNFNFIDNVWENYWNGQTDRVLDWFAGDTIGNSSRLLHGALGGPLNTNQTERIVGVRCIGNIVRHGQARFLFDGDKTGITGFKLNDPGVTDNFQNIEFRHNIIEIGSNLALQINATVDSTFSNNTFLRGASWTANGFTGVAMISVFSGLDNFDNSNVKLQRNILEGMSISTARTSGSNGPDDQLEWMDNIIVNAAYDDPTPGAISRGAVDYLLGYNVGQDAQAIYDQWRPKPGTTAAAKNVGAFSTYTIGSGGVLTDQTLTVPAAAAATAWTPARVTYPGTTGFRSTANLGLTTAAATVIAKFKSSELGTWRRIFSTAGGTLAIVRHPTDNRIQIVAEKAGNLKVANAMSLAYDTSVDMAIAVSLDVANDLFTIAVNGRNVPINAINPTSITDAGTPLSQASAIDSAALVGAWGTTTSSEFWLGDTMALGFRLGYTALDTDAGLSSIFADTAGGLIVPTPAEWAILLHGPAAEHGTGAWNKGTLSMGWTKLGTGTLTDV